MSKARNLANTIYSSISIAHDRTQGQRLYEEHLRATADARNAENRNSENPRQGEWRVAGRNGERGLRLFNPYQNTRDNDGGGVPPRPALATTTHGRAPWPAPTTQRPGPTSPWSTVTTPWPAPAAPAAAAATTATSPAGGRAPVLAAAAPAPAAGVPRPAAAAEAAAWQLVPGTEVTQSPPRPGRVPGWPPQAATSGRHAAAPQLVRGQEWEPQPYQQQQLGEWQPYRRGPPLTGANAQSINQSASLENWRGAVPAPAAPWPPVLQAQKRRGSELEGRSPRIPRMSVDSQTEMEMAPTTPDPAHHQRLQGPPQPAQQQQQHPDQQ